jgi:hypothetical protein
MRHPLRYLSEERVGSSQPQLEYYWVQQLTKGPLMHSLLIRTACCLFLQYASASAARKSDSSALQQAAGQQALQGSAHGRT